MEKRVTEIKNLKPGSYVLIDDVPCKVDSIQLSKSGKHGHAKNRITAVGLVDQKKRIVVLPAHDNVEVPIIEKKSAQVLSVSGDKANVMDSESYETFDVDIPQELKPEVIEGCSILYWTILDQKVMKQIKKTE